MLNVIQFLSNIFPFLEKMSGIPLYVFYIVLSATTIFLALFIPKTILIIREINVINKGIRNLKLAAGLPSATIPEDVKKLMFKEPYKHLWSEYDDTLHRLKRYSSENGDATEVRATIPAEVYFTSETLVDSRLFEEFVRHLPGILTGLGIIGTFAGLLDGLHGFTPSEDASSARESLKLLLDGVGHAFYASATAIGSAMLVTLIEKLSIAVLYKKVEQLNHEIDSIYNTGAGEEYLSRLVDATETNAAQTAQLKDALVEDLHKMMSNLVDKQIEAQRQQSELLGDRIGKSISDGLATPMQELMGIVDKASGQQGAAVHGMLENLLSAFMAKIEDTFGSQMHNINNALQQSMQSMASVQTSMEKLVTDIGNAGESAASQMSNKLEESMDRAANAQERMNEQMREFVIEIRRLIEEQQSQSKVAMDDAVNNVLEQMGTAMQKLADDRATSSQAEQGRQETLRTHTKELYGGLTDEVTSLLKTISDTTSKSEENISKLQEVSTHAISEMNEGARTMNAAANKFADAGNAVGNVLEKSEGLTTQLVTTSQTLQSSANAVKQAFEQYDKTRGAVERYVGELTTMIETAKRDAGVNKQLVDDMERIIGGLKGVEEQTVSYINQINEVLQRAFNDFGTALTNQISATIGQTDKHLSTSVQHLRGYSQDLGQTMEELGDHLSRWKKD